MAEETDLTVQILRQIQADLSEIKTTLADHGNHLGTIQEKLSLHGERLNNHTAMFEDVGDRLKEIRGLLKDYAIAQELRRTMADLTKRVQALESLQQ